MKTLIICATILLFSILNTTAKEYYVSPDGNSSNSGTKDEPWSLSKANNSLLPGDTAILMNGTYTVTPIAPIRSGSMGAYITYRAESRHNAVFQDIVELANSNGPVAIFVNDKSYISIVGIKVTGVKRWVVAYRSDHISIDQCYFLNGSGWSNCRFEDNIGDGMRITRNYFSEGTDLCTLDGGEGHLVEGNFFGDAEHTGLVLLGVKNSVVRNNTFNNRLWRNMEVESQRHVPYGHSINNLIENNYFDFSPGNGSIQYAGNYSIIRRNIFSRANGGMKWANYLGSAKNPEAWHDAHNRFYNNVIAECGANDIVSQIIEENKQIGINPAGNVADDGFGMIIQTNLFNPENPNHPEPGNCEYGDNISVNNIFYKNSNTKYSKASETSQISYTWNATPEFVKIYNNNIFGGTAGTDAFYFEDAVSQNPPQERNTTIDELELLYPDNVYDNIDVDPQFTDALNRNYRLTNGSNCIDQGVALTRTVSGGQGTVIPVLDAIYFTDGYGLIDTDTIRINSKRLAIVDIDYDLNTITVDKELSWQLDDKVFFDFEGNAPDMGSFEYGSSYIIGADESLFKPEAITGLNESIGLSLHWIGNYPNPFQQTTSIQFELDEPSDITIEIFDISGSKIITLRKDFFSAAGRHQIEWNGQNQDGVKASTGIYFCRLTTAGEHVITSKMSLLKN